MHRFVRTTVFGPLLLAALVCTGGCNIARITINNPLTPNDVAFIEPGKTTFGDVLATLGTPDALSDSNEGIVATYRFMDLKYSRVNFGWVFRFWSPVDPDLVISRTGVGSDAFEVFYDPQGIVSHHAFLHRDAGPRFNPIPF